MELTQALTFRYSSVAQELLCGPDAIAGLGGALDRLGAETAMIVCGPRCLFRKFTASSLGAQASRLL
jgi:hypothetical protein